MCLSDIKILRLEHGDTDEEYPILLDEEYQYFISTYPNKKKRAKLIDIAILAALAGQVRERSGQEEIHSHQAFNNRKELLKIKYKDPTFNGGAESGGVIVGGVYRDEMASIATDPTLVSDVFYKGQSLGVPTWMRDKSYNVPNFYFCGYIGYRGVCRFYPYIYRL